MDEEGMTAQETRLVTHLFSCSFTVCIMDSLCARLC
jgi:hypothetical protein